MLMRRVQRICALLLMLVLLLSLAPLAAQADPPQGECREGGEHIWDVVEDSATCTESGTRTWRCRKCGIWWNETSPALGHAWNEGVLIQGEGLLSPQKMHYYCWRCGGTKDEYVYPTGASVLDEFRHLTGDAKGSSDLVITLQPVGGVLRDEADASLTMTVAAEGGVEPYTYEWRGVDKGFTEYLDGNPVGYAAHSNSRRAAEEANRRRTAFYEQYLKFSLEHGGTEDLEGAARAWTELQIREYGDIELSLGEDPSYTAEIGDCFYYCVVRDAAGHSIESERAFVAVPLYIEKQPEDATLRDGKAVLYCGAAGGSGSYSFYWYLGDTKHPVGVNSSTLIAYEAGEYFCSVTDGDQTATSDPAKVAKEKTTAAPIITVQPKNKTLAAKSSGKYSVKLTCKARLPVDSSGDLVYCWQKKTAGGWKTLQRGSKTTFTRSGKSGVVSGQYRCIVINSESRNRIVSNTATVKVTMSCKKFHFSGRTLKAQIHGGTPPYKVVIVQHRPKDKEKPSVNIATVKVGNSGKFSKPLSPQKYRYYTYLTKENGQWVTKRARAYYSITVYDSSGQACETNIIYYPN